MKLNVINRQSFTEIRRKRRLPFPGQVLVEMGQSVQPEDIVAEAILPGKILPLDISKGLGLDPAEVLSFLVRDAGEDLEAGDIIAESDGALPRLVRTPKSGKLLACRDGIAWIATGQVLVQIKAGLIGVVSDIFPEWGAEIITQGIFIEGVWGNNKVGAGILRELSVDSKQTIDDAEIQSLEKGQIIVAESCLQEPGLTFIASRNPAGLILGSMVPGLVRLAEGLPFPVILLQGFGEFQPDPYCFTMLADSFGEVACINAIKENIFESTRPEVFIPKESGELEKPKPFYSTPSKGQWVQILSGDSKGKIGTVVDLPSEKVVLESGLTSEVAKVNLDEEEQKVVPLCNLIVLGGQNPEKKNAENDHSPTLNDEEN